MNKRSKTLLAEIEANNKRINELADLCEAEQRSMTEAEEREYRSLERANQLAIMRLQSLPVLRAEPEAQNLTAAVRSAVAAAGQSPFRLELRANEIKTADVAETGLVPVSVESYLAPLRAGLIWDKLGIKVQHGIVGTLRWPVHGKAVAQWRGEGQAVTNSKIDFDKLPMSGHPLSVKVTVTREALEGTEGIVEQIIREELPKAISDAINQRMLATTATASQKVSGPFVAAMTDATEFDADVPTRLELLQLKGQLAMEGCLDGYCAWTMPEAMKLMLEATPMDAGSGRFLVEDDKILGYPVLTSNDIPDGYVGFGNWGYQAAGFFGSDTLIVNPYSAADSNEVEFVLHVNFGTVTLRPEAFVLGKATAPASA